MYIYNNKQLLAAIALLSIMWSQNDGLVITKYDNGGVKTEGNYVNGVRNGAWAEYLEEVWWYDYGEDGEANTKDTLENNNRWDSVEVVIPNFKPKLKVQGKYTNGTEMIPGLNIMKMEKEKLNSIIPMGSLMVFNHIGIQMVIKLKKKII